MKGIPRTVPFADLHAQYLTIRSEVDDAIAAVIRDSAFIRGPFVDRFEQEFAAAIGLDHCVSCANGTDALYIAMRSLDLRAGDEVITSAHSWIATSETVTQAGGNVVFCDTTADGYTIDPARIEEKVTSRTVGIIPVHLYGRPADMPAIMRIAEKHRLWVIEDCAQAHLARIAGRGVGTFGAAATFSFYPGKNLGAMGDAGAIVTGDAALARRMASFARHGGLLKNSHEIEGINSRLDGLQAAILSVKLRYLPDWTRKRIDIANAYGERLAGLDSLQPPTASPGLTHVYHLYVVKHKARDELAAHLRDRGIQTAINYPIALPFLKAYARLGHRPDEFANAFRNQSRILSLPIYAEMHPSDIDYVARSIAEFCARVGFDRQPPPDLRVAQVS